MNGIQTLCQAVAEHDAANGLYRNRTGVAGLVRLLKARGADVSHTGVQRWLYAGEVPPKRVLEVWAIAQSIGCPVTPYDLNPSVFLLPGGEVPEWPARPHCNPSSGQGESRSTAAAQG